MSGHAVLGAAVATVLMPVLPGRWRLLPWVFVLLNGIARIYVGAHNPLDVVGGIGLGVFIGGLINAVLAPHGGDRPALEEPSPAREAREPMASGA